MFRIKICGITRPEDAILAADAGADAIGLNFYAKSPRCLSTAAAAPILAAVGSRVQKLGVFVNSPAEEVIATYEKLGLDLVQLHGDEPPDFLQRLGGIPVVRAFRCGPAGLAPIGAYLEACRVYGCPPRLVLIDAYDPGSYGGTGNVAPWNAAARFRELRFPYPLILAGGLTPDNVAEAIAQVRPVAVDTASGVEASPGIKDAARMRDFIQRAREAFAALT